MILSDFVLNSRVNKSWEYSGIDSFKDCLDKEHFKRYPHKVSYNYNSRGFRDKEWPESIDELKNAIWCIGDSFTVGIGSPIEHTWPYLLELKTGRRCINVSMDGASNEWIARKAKRIIEEINPDKIVIMWSFISRREDKNDLMSDEDRRLHSIPYCSNLDDIINFKTCVDLVSQIKDKINHFQIPINWKYLEELINTYNNVSGESWEKISTIDNFLNLPVYIISELTDLKVYNRMLEIAEFVDIINKYGILEVPQLDRARDYQHFDLITSQWVVNKII